LNKFIISNYPAILKFFYEYYGYNFNLDKKFFDVIYKTRNKNINIDIFGSNCGTLLNYSSKFLVKKDFNNTKIPYADFKNAF